MIVYIIMLFLILAYPIKQDSDKKKKRKYIIFSFLILFVVSALRKYTIGIDLKLIYARDFTLMAKTSWEKLDVFRYEVGYTYFCKLISYISSNPQCLIVITSFIINFSVCRFIYRNSDNVKMSLAIYICFNIFFMYMNVLRQALAISIILFGMEFFKEKKYIKFGITVVIASLFHTSAILCLFFIVMDKIKFRRLDIIGSIVIYLGSLVFYNYIFSFVTSVLGKYDGYVDKTSQNVGFFNFYSFFNIFMILVMCILIYYQLIYKKKKLDKNCDDKSNELKSGFSGSLIMQFSIYALIFQSTVLTMNILSRMRHYFFFMLIIGVPKAVNSASKKYKQLLSLGVYTLLLIFFVWTSLKTSNTQFGTIPYEFFWRD